MFDHTEQPYRPRGTLDVPYSQKNEVVFALLPYGHGAFTPFLYIGYTSWKQELDLPHRIGRPWLLCIRVSNRDLGLSITEGSKACGLKSERFH